MVATKSVYFALALLMGLGGAFAAQGFIMLVGWLAALLTSFGNPVPAGYVTGFIGLEATLKMAAMLFGAAALVMAVLYKSGQTRFTGPADTIEAARRPSARVDIKEGLVSTLVAAISMGGGAPVGQYGPLAHLGATLAAMVAKLGKLPRGAAETLLACGVAGAISAAFGAPLAGILFAHEAVLRHFSLRAFAPVTISAAMAYAIVQNFFPAPHFLPAINVQLADVSQLVGLVVIGLGGGLVASAFMGFCLKTERTAPHMGVPFWLLPLGAASVLLLGGAFVPQVLGSRPDILIAAINGEIILSSLIIFGILKLLLAALSIALGLYAGVFAPALFIGVMFGGAIGQMALSMGLVGADSIGLFALAGMGAVISSTIGAPITTILIVLELTGDYSATTGVMISVVFANMVSTKLFGRSLFDRKLLARGLDMALSRNDFKLAQIPLGTLVLTDYCRLDEAASREEKIKALIDSGCSEGYVVHTDGRLAAKYDLLNLLSSQSGAEDRPFDILQADMSVLDAMGRLSDFVGESLPVTDAQGKMLGIVTEGRIFSHYQKLAAQSHAEENS